MAQEIDLQVIEKAIRKLELNFSECRRKKLEGADLQKKLEENYKIISDSGLTLGKIKELHSKIPKRYIESFKRQISKGIVKISGSRFFLPLPDILSGKSEYSLKLLFRNFERQIIFCFYLRCLITYLIQSQLWPKDVQRLVYRYDAYKFTENEIKFGRPFGVKTAEALGFKLVIDPKRVSRGMALYLLHLTGFGKWAYYHRGMHGEISAETILARVSSFSQPRATRMVSVENINLPAEEWGWSCDCEDFIVHKHRREILVCQHVAAVLWRILDEEKIKIDSRLF